MVENISRWTAPDGSIETIEWHEEEKILTGYVVDEATKEIILKDGKIQKYACLKAKKK